jgi:predicted O-methyltransferase YrrM
MPSPTARLAASTEPTCSNTRMPAMTCVITGAGRRPTPREPMAPALLTATARSGVMPTKAMPAWAIGELRPYAVVRRVWSSLPATLPESGRRPCPAPDTSRDENVPVDESMRTLLAELFDEGATHDAAEPDRLRRRRNLEPETAALLTLVLRVAGARTIVEIGTSNGYSTIWLADAARATGGTVTSVDVEEWPGLRDNLTRAGVEPELVIADGGTYLAGQADASVDLLFLDAERVEYESWWPHPTRVLKDGGVLAMDNVLSHPDEVATVLALIAADPEFTGETIAVGKGLHLAVKRARGGTTPPR